MDAARRRIPGRTVAQVAVDGVSRDDADGGRWPVGVADVAAVGGPAATGGDDAGKRKVSPDVQHVSIVRVHVCWRLFRVGLPCMPAVGNVFMVSYLTENKRTEGFKVVKKVMPSNSTTRLEILERGEKKSREKLEVARESRRLFSRG